MSIMSKKKIKQLVIINLIIKIYSNLRSLFEFDFRPPIF